MYIVLRAVVIYLLLLVVFRLAGKRTLESATTFDLVLLLIVSEVIQGAILTNDASLTNAMVIVITLIGLDILMSLIKQRSKLADKVLDSMPVIIVDNGRLLQDRLKQARIDETDILEKARELQGLERIDQIKYAILERSGVITIIPNA